MQKMIGDDDSFYNRNNFELLRYRYSFHKIKTGSGLDADQAIRERLDNIQRIYREKKYFDVIANIRSEKSTSRKVEHTKS